MRRSIFAVASAAGLFLFNSDASACEPPYVPPTEGCRAAALHGIAGTPLPANAPGILVDDAGPQEALELVDSAGTSVPFTLGPGWFGAELIFGEALRPGETYTLRYDEACYDGTSHEATHRRSELQFSTGDALPLPTSVGSIVAEVSDIRIGVYDQSDSCGGNRIGDVAGKEASLRVQLPEELKPWLPVLKLDKELDGQRYLGDTIRARCDGNANFTSPTIHTVTSLGRLAGSEEVFARASTDVDLRCPSAFDSFADAVGCAHVPAGSVAPYGLIVVAALASLRSRRPGPRRREP